MGYPSVGGAEALVAWIGAGWQGYGPHLWDIHRTPGPEHRGARPRGLPEDAKGPQLWDGQGGAASSKVTIYGMPLRGRSAIGHRIWDAPGDKSLCLWEARAAGAAPPRTDLDEACRALGHHEIELCDCFPIGN